MRKMQITIEYIAPYVVVLVTSSAASVFATQFNTIAPKDVEADQFVPLHPSLPSG
jgi:hypothetical protein